MKYKKLKQNLILKDFQPIWFVSWETIEYVMGKRRCKKFRKWMSGQTVPMGGVYADDLDRFLKGLPVID